MDIELFKRLIRNIFNVPIISYSGDETILDEFEKNICYDKTLQPMYTKEFFLYAFSNMNENTFYEIFGNLFTNLILFKVEDVFFIVGPFLDQNISPELIQDDLAKKGLSHSNLISLYNYHSAFTKMNPSWIESTMVSCLRSFDENITNFSTRQLKGFHEEINEEKIVEIIKDDYSLIQKRYEEENYLLNLIRDGDVDGVNIALNSLLNKDKYSNDRTLDLSIYNNTSSINIIRTLARKAAEEGGCPIITINEITQRSILKQAQSNSFVENQKNTFKVILELAQAVKDAKTNLNYSHNIKLVASYLISYYSEDISLEELAELARVSPSYLSRTFKAETGKTITEYITDLRLDKAVELLLKSELPISEIASYVGYYDNNYFSRIFKKRYGMTPSQYRSKNIK